jgi:hypothetical protein
MSNQPPRFLPENRLAALRFVQNFRRSLFGERLLMPRMHLATALMIVTLTACGGSGNTTDAGNTIDTPAGSNTISGTVKGTGFTTVGATYWIGAPDSPATDTVVYMFDRAVQCNQITTIGWDTALASGTQILELKMVGKTPAAYPTTTSPSHIPAAGESLSSYTVAAAGAMDNIATGGSVTLTTIGTPTAGSAATGSFHLTFGTDSLDGTYASPFCMAGREP